MAVCIFVNTVVAGLLPVLEGIILLVHVLGFIAILITLVCLSPHGSAEDVFFRSLNEGNWPTQGLSYCVGFIGKWQPLSVSVPKSQKRCHPKKTSKSGDITDPEWNTVGADAAVHVSTRVIRISKPSTDPVRW